MCLLSIQSFRNNSVDPVRENRRDDHQHAHREDPDDQLRLNFCAARSEGQLAGLIEAHAGRKHDEADESHTGHAVGFEAVSRRTDGVAGVVTGTVRDHARVTSVVFFNVENDFH